MAGGRNNGYRAVLAVGEFRALWAAECQSVIGDQLAKVALMVLVFDRTGSAALAALIYALMLLPALVGGPLLSGLADVYPRRTVMAICSLVQAALVAVMAVPGQPLPVLFGLVVVVQLAQAPFIAARTAIVPTILSGELYQQGQALQQATRQIGMVAGLGLGGLAVTAIGVSSALLLDAVTFVVAAVVIWGWVRHRPAATAEPATGATGRVRQAAVVIWRDPRLRWLVALTWLAGFAVVPEGLVVPFVAEIGAGPSAAGWLLAADPAAMAVVAVLLARLIPTPVRLRLLGPLALVCVTALVGFAAEPGFAGALVLLAVSGGAAAYQATAQATFVDLVPDAHRGQAVGLARAGLTAGQGLGVAAGGLVAELVGSAATAVALAGLVGVVCAAPAAARWSRALRQRPVMAKVSEA